MLTSLHRPNHRSSSSPMMQKSITKTTRRRTSSEPMTTWASSTRRTSSLKTRSYFCATIVPTETAMLLVLAGQIYIDTSRRSTVKSCVISAQGTRKSSLTNMSSSALASYGSTRNSATTILEQSTSLGLRDIQNAVSADRGSMVMTSCTIIVEKSMRDATFAIGETVAETLSIIETTRSWRSTLEMFTSSVLTQSVRQTRRMYSNLRWTSRLISYQSTLMGCRRTQGEMPG
jgi:hypothetical protein